MTQKEAIKEALKRLDGKAKMSEICKLAQSIGDFSNSKKPENTIRNCIYTNPSDFRPLGCGFWELVSYQGELARRDQLIRELEEENARLKAVKTEDDFVVKFVEKVKHNLKRDKKTVEEIRKLMDALGRSDAHKELDEWLQGKDKTKTKPVTKQIIRKTIKMTGKNATYNEKTINK